MSNANGIGAPKGGRVHFFLFYLHKYVKQHYRIEGDYLKHDYFLSKRAINKAEREVADYFMVKRTCKTCFSVMHFSSETKVMTKTSCKSAEKAAQYVNAVVLCRDVIKEDSRSDEL